MCKRKKTIDTTDVLTVRIRGGFSERMGVYKCNISMQIKELDQRTRTLINNNLWELLSIVFEKSGFYYNNQEIDYGSNAFCKAILSEVFAIRTALHSGKVYVWEIIYDNYINPVIVGYPYNEVLDLVQFIVNWLYHNYQYHGGALPAIYDRFNNLFEKEFVGYRFINGEIVPITDEVEIKEINDSLSIPFQGARKHIEKALHFLSDRTNPDYKNCIKEGISAVESICQIIVGNNSATLGTALKKLENSGVSIHPALKSSFEKLYGYTSDEGGIRHAEGLFESNVTFDEAKFMTVTSCAFINYLLANYGKRK